MITAVGNIVSFPGAKVGRFLVLAFTIRPNKSNFRCLFDSNQINVEELIF